MKTYMISHDTNGFYAESINAESKEEAKEKYKRVNKLKRLPRGFAIWKFNYTPS